MFYRNQLDKPAADLELRTLKNKKFRIYDSDARYTVLYFYTLDCALCNAVSEDLKKMCAQYDPEEVRFLAIYTGTDNAWKKYAKGTPVPGWTELWDRKRTSGMFDKYDLLDVPAIYLLDSEKKTQAKDIIFAVPFFFGVYLINPPNLKI